jgi:hypothetical protein
MNISSEQYDEQYEEQRYHSTTSISQHLSQEDIVVKSNECKRIIEELIENIQQNTLLEMNQIDIINNVQFLTDNKNISLELTTIYNNMILHTLKEYDHIYNTKLNEIENVVLENISSDDKRNLFLDDEGNYRLIVKPLLMRSYEISLYNSMLDNPLFKLLMSIRNNMIHIREYELYITSLKN